MPKGQWEPSKDGGRFDLDYVVGRRVVGWVEQEMVREPAFTGPYVPTGRYHFGVGGTKGGRASRTAAKRAVERYLEA